MVYIDTRLLVFRLLVISVFRIILLGHNFCMTGKKMEKNAHFAVHADSSFALRGM